MQNPNNPNTFNNMNGPFMNNPFMNGLQQPWVQQPWDRASRMQPFPAGAAPFYPQGNFQQTPGGMHEFEKNQQRPAKNPWHKPSIFDIGGNPPGAGFKANIGEIESQIHSFIIRCILGHTPAIALNNSPQILSLNGYRIEGLGEKLKHFDKDAKVEIINSLMNFHSYIKSYSDSLSNILAAMENITKVLYANFENKTNMLKSLSTEIEIIKKSDGGESSEMVKKEALASLEELSSSLRDLGLTPEEVEAKLQLIQKALK